MLCVCVCVLFVLVSKWSWSITLTLSLLLLLLYIELVTIHMLLLMLMYIFFIFLLIHKFAYLCFFCLHCCILFVFCFVLFYIFSGSHIQVVSKSHKDHSYSSVYKIHTFSHTCVHIGTHIHIACTYTYVCMSQLISYFISSSLCLSFELS